MSKNTRWALALIGVVIIIVGAVLIGTGKDNTDATQGATQETTAPTGATQSSSATPETGSTGSTSKSGSGDSGGKDDEDSGGASPNDSGQDSGGASPGAAPKEDSGGAGANIGASDVVSPVLTEGKVRTVKARKGEVVTIRAFSNSRGEVHVHGYNKEYLLDGSTVTRFKFKATIDGEFAIEFHLPDGSHADVGTLRVSP